MLAQELSVAQRGLERHQLQRARARGGGVERWNRLHPRAAGAQPRRRAVPGRRRRRWSPPPTTSAPIRSSSPPYVAAAFAALGTDGFGRSDTRAGLRASSRSTGTRSCSLHLPRRRRRGPAPLSVAQPIERYGIDVEAAAPWSR